MTMILAFALGVAVGMLFGVWVLGDERRRRLYYQGQCYRVANELDRVFGFPTTRVGTVDDPANDLHSRVSHLVAWRNSYESEDNVGGL